jgi:hypothetical protein
MDAEPTISKTLVLLLITAMVLSVIVFGSR